MSRVHRPVKDEDAEHRVPALLRPVISDIVRSFVRHDYQLADGIDSVRQIEKKTAGQICEYIEDYGETLVDLPMRRGTVRSPSGSAPTGRCSSICGPTERGRSDLVLHADVRETGSGYSFEIQLVYVP